MSGVVLAVALAIGRNLLSERLPGKVWGAGSCGGKVLNRARFAAGKTHYKVRAASHASSKPCRMGVLAVTTSIARFTAESTHPISSGKGDPLRNLAGGLFGRSACNEARLTHGYAPDVVWEWPPRNPAGCRLGGDARNRARFTSETTPLIW